MVLIAGSAHVDPALGVPYHLAQQAATMRVQAVTWPPAPPARDYCADLRRQMQEMRPAAKP